MSIVQFFFDEGSASRCGYCSNDSSLTKGMWLHRVTCSDHQALTNRNWRRSGNYGYHPVMDKTCCPQYMIRCDTTSFKINKDQRYVIRKFNRYVRDGCTKSSESSQPSNNAALNNSNSTGVHESTAGAAKQEQKTPKPGAGADPNKPRCLKAKDLRKQKKLEKLSKKMDSSQGEQRPAAQQQPVEQTGMNELTDLLNDNNGMDCKLKFTTRMVSSRKLKEDSVMLKKEHEVYKKYQISVHGDDESTPNVKQFTRFLIDTPIMTEQTPAGVALGSYHHQYWLGDRLVAVEVMDILPECISSVYVFYDPEFSYLAIGKYSALVSIELVRRYNKSLPSLKYYLMGFYIHSCHKMRYKGDYNSSYLLCPLTYHWVPIEICRPKLDVKKYCRLSEDTTADAHHVTDENIHRKLTFFFDGSPVPYNNIPTSERPSPSNIKLMASLIGEQTVQSIVYVI